MDIAHSDSEKYENRTSDFNKLYKKIGKEPLRKWMMAKGAPRPKPNLTEDDGRPTASRQDIDVTMWDSLYTSQSLFNSKADQGQMLDFGAKPDQTNFPFLQYTAETGYNDSVVVTDSSLPFSTGTFDLNRTTFNVTVIPTSQASPSGYDILRWVHIPAYAVILCLAVAGNALVIGTLAPRRRVRSLTNVFLLNLAVADLLLGLLCVPFTLVGAILRDFVFGGAMCKLIPYLQAVSVSVSAWTLVAISVERYFAICHPLRSRRWQTLSHAYKLITLIWFGSLTAMAPVAALSELQPTSQGHHKCRERWPSLDFERAYNVLLDVVLLVLPLAILTATYSLITRTLRRGMRLERAQRKKRGEDVEPPRDRWHLRRGRYAAEPTDDSDESDDDEESGELRRSDAERSLRSKRRVIRMLFVLVLEFFVCWTPLHALNTAASFFGAHAVYSGIGGYPAVAACHLLAYCSSCCNPITYGFMNARFRQAFLGAFGCPRRGKKGGGGNASGDPKGLGATRGIRLAGNSTAEGGRGDSRPSTAFALSYTGGNSAALRASGGEDCTDSLSEFLPSMLESKCVDEPREGLDDVLGDNNR
ncbi:cholecystokinin receptor type A-like [Hetaerina americana]|uniref:cholecystokinin receptor type A-like n=1 Tax=Hetaerina americana TaxID=62018 RepID=UPI003A7F567D